MVKITFSEGFEKSFKKLKDKNFKERIIKQIEKLTNNPEAGKPLRYDLKMERTIYIKPYRLIYSFKEDEIILLRFMHRKDVYNK